MIYLGLTPPERADAIRAYMVEHNITKVYMFTPPRFMLPGWTEEWTTPETEPGGQPGRWIEWRFVQFYRYYYRLLQEIDHGTLVVLNEPLRSQNRHCLDYNCVRQYLQQTRHVLIFLTLPIIAEPDDFMVPIDWCTRSRWKREPFDAAMLSEVVVRGRAVLPTFERVPVACTPATHRRYAVLRERLFAEIRENIDKDPHVLPRNLAQVSGADKAAVLGECEPYLARSQRLGGAVATFADVSSAGRRTVLELPHNFGQYVDALTVTGAPDVRLLVGDTKADRWYADRYDAWAGRVRDVATTALHR